MNWMKSKVVKWLGRPQEIEDQVVVCQSASEKHYQELMETYWTKLRGKEDGRESEERQASEVDELRAMRG